MVRLDDLSNAERKIGRALLANYPTAGLTTAADLAARAGVSPPTVARFVTRLGFAGFPAMQRALVHELNDELGSPLRQLAEKGGGSGDRLLAATSSAFADMLATTYSELADSEFTRLASLLADPSRDVRVAGGRYSRLLADYLVQHLRLLRTGVAMIGSEELDRRTAVLDATSRTVFLVFDYRRYSEANVRLAEQMASNGAMVCLMTDNWLSPIAKIAKIVLPVRVDSASPYDSLVAATAVTESLVSAVAELRGPEGVKRLERLEQTED